MEFTAVCVILFHLMYHRYTVTFCDPCMQMTTCNQKSIRRTFPFIVFSARYFIMKCNNQRNLDISMAKVTTVPYIYLVNYIFIF